MERFYFDAGLLSVFAGRETNSDWGIETAPGTVEIWVGKTYLCASFVEAKIRTAVRTSAIAAIAFVIGWMLDPPLRVQLALDTILGAS